MPCGRQNWSRAPATSQNPPVRGSTRTGISADDLTALEDLLGRLAANVTAGVP